MADTYSNEYTKINSGIESSTVDRLVRPDELGGRERIALFTGRTAAEEAGDTITLTKLPAGARVTDIEFCCDDASAGAATIAIGDASDPDRLVSAFDIGTAAVAHRNDGSVFLGLRTPDNDDTDQTVGFAYRYTSETVILATVAAATLSTGADYAGLIRYVVD